MIWNLTGGSWKTTFVKGLAGFHKNQSTNWSEQLRRPQIRWTAAPRNIRLKVKLQTRPRGSERLTRTRAAHFRLVKTSFGQREWVGGGGGGGGVASSLPEKVTVKIASVKLLNGTCQGCLDEYPSWRKGAQMTWKTHWRYFERRSIEVTTGTNVWFFWA